jgi:hypothetical protein
MPTNKIDVVRCTASLLVPFVLSASHLQLALPFKLSLSYTMADPLSISASVVSFVAFALQVATTSADFLRDAKGFPDEFTKLTLATNEFATHVRRLAPTIGEVEARYGTETGFPFLLIVANVVQIEPTRWKIAVRFLKASTRYWGTRY